MSIKNYLSKLKNSSWHQKSHVLVGFLVTFLCYALGVNIVFSVLFGLASGLIKELLYCYAPIKEVNVLWFTFYIVDYNGLKQSIKNMNIITRHEFDDTNVFYCISGVVISVLLKIILFFL